MAIRNTKMGGVDFTSTTEATFTDFNDTLNRAIRIGTEISMKQAGINNIRVLQDRTGIFSKGGIDGFAEAYIDDDGRNNTVVTGSSATFDTDKYKATGTTISYVYHDITANIIPDDTNNVFGIPLIEDWETGNSIHYKVYNGSTDTGWLTVGSFHPVTAFDAPITKLQVRLSPTLVTGTAGYPSINGFFIHGQNI